MNKTAFVDIDNCLADFEGQLVTYLAEKHGGDAFLKRHLYSLTERFDGKPELAMDAVAFVTDPNSYYGLSPIVPMVEFAAGLEEQGAVIYLSSRPMECLNFTIRWLKKHGLLTNPDIHLVFCGVEDKFYFLEDLQTSDEVSVDFIVEDSPTHINSLRESFTVLTFDRPWNQGLYPRITDRNGVLMYQSVAGERAEPLYEAFG